MQTIYTYLRIPLLALLLVLGTGACDALGAPRDQALRASGTVEVVEVLVAAEFGGRVIEVFVQEGSLVEAGDPLFRLDDESLRIRREQVSAVGAAAIAAARFELLSAQQSLDDLYDDHPLLAAQAQFNLAQAADALDDAEYTWRVRQPGQRASGETIAAAEANLVLAEREVDRAEKAYNRYSGRADDDPSKALARSNLAAARTHRDSVLRNLNWYKGSPTDLDQALLDAEVALAEAQVAEAQRQWERLKDGPDARVLALAEARIENAQAQLAAAEANQQAELESLDLELQKFIVLAPVSGVVLTRAVEPGEVLQPGASAMSLGQMDQPTVTVYIPEDRYGQIDLGDTAQVTADSFPGEAFEAVVTRIADRAEYTPRNVQTEEERRTTVFAIELSVVDPQGKLKPGMPADVRFES